MYPNELIVWSHGAKIIERSTGPFGLSATHDHQDRALGAIDGVALETPHLRWLFILDQNGLFRSRGKAEDVTSARCVVR